MLIGSLLSMALPGCAGKPIETTPPPPIVVTAKDKPPADLLACPVRPAPIPDGLSATIPAPARRALIDLAAAYRAAVGQLERLINWHDPPQPCQP